jgi:Protein of unknown function (DUF1439)
MDLLKRQLFKKSVGMVGAYLLLKPNTSLAQSNYYIPSQLINLYLIHHSPFTKNLLFFTIQCSNPVLDFVKKGQRLYLNCNIEISIPNQKSVKGALALDSSFQYDPKTYQIALLDPRISSIDLDVLNEKDNLLLKQLSPFLGPMFNQQVVYELSSSDIKMLKKPPSSILIEDGGLRFNFD